MSQKITKMLLAKIALVLVLVFANPLTPDASVKVVVYGKELKANAVTMNGRTMVPMRAILEAFGAKVSRTKSFRTSATA